MLSQEWAAIRTILRLLDEEHKGPTELTIELLCIVVAGNGESMSSCGLNMIEPNNTMKMAIGKEAILQRTFNIKNFSLSLQCTISEL